jgi:hypothetical protein
MTRYLCVVFFVLALAPISVETPDFSGTYTLIPDRSVATEQVVYSPVSAPDSISGRTVAGACGDQFVISQTSTRVTVGVVSGQTAANRYSGVPVDGTYELDHPTTTSNGYKATLLQRGPALELTLSYTDNTRPSRFQYVFRAGKDGTLTVEYMSNSSAYEVLHNWPYRSVKSVYQKSAP